MVPVIRVLEEEEEVEGKGKWKRKGNVPADLLKLSTSRVLADGSKETELGLEVFTEKDTEVTLSN